MTTNSLRLPSAFAALFAASICAASWSFGRVAEYPRLRDDSLAKVIGTNGKQLGTSGYSCTDAAAAAFNGSVLTGPGCNAIANSNLNPDPSQNKSCILCTGTLSINGYFTNSKSTQVIVDTGNLVTCSTGLQGLPSSLSYSGKCTQDFSGFGRCVGAIAPTKLPCPGSFEAYTAQVN